jgi:transmembrane sensor
MNQKHLRELLKRRHEQKLDDNEIDELNNWYHQLKDGSGDFEKLARQYGGDDGLKKHLYSNFIDKLEKDRRLGDNKIWYRVAAILIVGVMISAWFFKENGKMATSKVARVSKQDSPSPGTNKATLILADGRKVQLNNSQESIAVTQPGVNIKKVGNGKLVYSDHGAAPGNSLTAYNTIATPRAGEYQLVLSDGTRVWLNSQTTLRYPLKFTGREREVELVGEAYFEVVYNKAMPFRVIAGEQTITDLGTHFNIKAYEDDKTIATTLLEGSVNVSDKLSGQNKLLIPGEQASVIKDKGTITVTNARLDEVTAWKNGYFIFDNEGVSSVMKMISRWYDVDVTYHLTKNTHFGGTFSRSSNLNDLLKSLELVGNLHCELKERRIIVSN